MTDQSAENKIANIIKTIRSWSLLWDLEELFKEIVKNSVNLLEADFGYLLLLEPNGLIEKSKYSKGESQPLSYLPEIAEKVIRHGESVYAHGLDNTEHKNSQIYCVPMTANRGVLGVLYIELLHRKEEINADEKLVFEMLGLQAASFLENSILYHSAITDPLTNLFSHRHFQQECDQMIRRAIRTQAEISMIIMDLDHFKTLNDTYGHEEGNICLKRISEILKGKFRSTDIIARFGGDEFEILLPDASTEKCLAIAKSLNEQIKNENFPMKISATIGIATFPHHASDTQSLFLAADQALYIGKEKGRNCEVVSTLNPKNKNIDADISKEFISKKSTEPTSIQSAFPNEIKKEIQRIDGLDIVRRIASSSNGEVLLAKQHELERFVALKRPLTAHLTEEQANAFKKEAFITASLSHPGVVPLYTMGRGIDERLYYTMKPIKGISLEDLLKKWQKKDSYVIKEYNLIKLIHILMNACETVAYAHSKNVAHLDIHPGNIIIGEFGDVTLIDWGKGIKLNEESKDSSASGIYISGSPIYRPPEQINNGKVGKFTDVYSLGIILFEILTEKTPFKKQTTKETIEAITDGIQNTPEEQYLNYGIDPLLSKACKLAINKNIKARLDASELSKILSRFAMFEVEIKTYNFQNNLMKSDDWHNVYPSFNGWCYKEGIWNTTKEFAQNLLYWKTPVTGNFSFTCEGWVTEIPNEIALVCYGKSIMDKTGWDQPREVYKGYWFQFGADNNLYTKIARHGEDILVDANYTIEKDKKYTLTISYQDGWLRCYIDKVLVFNYRELHPFYGHHIGFYSYGKGSYFRPIEVKYQNAGLKIPSIRLADEHFSFNRLDAAISKYNEIIEGFPDRLEGLESTLKKGYCLAKQGKNLEATQAFEKLQNTILEPYALIGMAMLEMPINEYELFQKDGDYKKAYSFFQTIVDKFKNHQAIFRILPLCSTLKDPFKSNHAVFKKNREEQVYYKMKIIKIGLETLNPPGQTQIICLGYYLNHLIRLGYWKDTTQTIKYYLKNYRKYLLNRKSICEEYYEILYSCEELETFNDYFKFILNANSARDIHPAVILDLHPNSGYFLEFNYHHSINSWKEFSFCLIHNLGQIETLEFKKLSEPYSKISSQNQQLVHNLRVNEYLTFEILLAYEPKNIDNVTNFITDYCGTSYEHKEEANILNLYHHSLSYLFELDYNNSFRFLNDSNTFPTKINFLHEKRLLLTSFFYSLEYYGDLNKDELIFQNKINLIGSRLELANIFLNNEIVELSEKWPKKPTFQFFDLTLYCLWLFEKNEFTLLKKYLNQALNPNLGNAYFQPFLRKLESNMTEKLINEN